MAEAVQAAQRSVEIDLWRDASWRTLIEAHRAAGDPASAERAKRQYAEVLTSIGVSVLPSAPVGPATSASGQRDISRA